MTRARTLSKLGSSPAVLSAGAVVSGITTIDASGFNITGVATATTFSGGWDGALSITDSTASTSTSTGALIVSGGVGIAKSLFVGEGVSVAGTITYDDVTNIDSVGIVTAGGGLYVGRTSIGVTATTAGHIIAAGVVTATSFDGSVSFASTSTVPGISTQGHSVFNTINASGIATASKFSGPGNIPGNVTTGTYTIVAADAGKLVSATGTVTLPAATFEVGDAISVYNNTGSDMTLTCSAPTAVYLGSDGSTVTSLTLALRCICTFVCVDTASNDTFVATGGGLS